MVKRGGENSPKSKCVNRGMQVHITKCQPSIMSEVQKEQVAMKNLPKADFRDESVRGTVPLFNLRNVNERNSFMGMVSLL